MDREMKIQPIMLPKFRYDEVNLKYKSKRREDILFWLKAAEKYANQYKQATDEKKRAKCGKSLQSAKESIQFAVNAVIDLGGSIDDIPEALSRERLEIWNEMFGNADSEDIAIEKEIQRIKKMLNETRTNSSKRKPMSADGC